ncbi:hypothetical protein EK21DRAFT_114467 [Setomelanomma holmii]|uniref:Uncharacterized protein n=1 Tax=Setomelanomma holmii TaxID=210430 RepID=A0A9P4H6G9_9PLEO|nr:hypothetical protein EK21DRAFT_114467 [Setomelanomma holmii]
MKYSMIFVGIVVLSADIMTRGQAARIPKESTTAVAAQNSNSNDKLNGPAFPVKLYVKKRGKSAPKDKLKRAFDCNGDKPWKKKGKTHCAAVDRWECYRNCFKDEVLAGDKLDSSKCKKFCKKHDVPQVSAISYVGSPIFVANDVNPDDCTSSSDDDFGCTIPSIRAEIEEEKTAQVIEVNAQKQEEAKQRLEAEPQTQSQPAKKPEEEAQRQTEDPKKDRQRVGQCSQDP